MRVAVVGQNPVLTACLQKAAETHPGLTLIAPAGTDVEDCDALIYLAETGRGHLPLPQKHQEKLFKTWRALGITRLLVLSSSQIHPPRHGFPGMVAEVAPARPSADLLSQRWLGLEQTATDVFGSGGDVQLTILRAAPVPVKGGRDYFSRLLSGRFSPTLPGYDPSIQLLTPESLAGTILQVMTQNLTGCYNVAPSAVIPLRKALSRAGVLRLPMPLTLQWLARKLLAPMGLAFSMDQLQRIRYPFTVSDDKLKAALNPPAAPTSYAAVCVLKKLPVPQQQPHCDPYGWDPNYVDFQIATQLRFLHDLFWRVEYEGLEHVPREGRALLVGVHRGFMPYDGTMILYAIKTIVKRYPRFLIHPCLVKQPILATFISKLGGLIACRENADWVLGRGELLGVFPEGIQGAFTPYKQAYQLGNMGRDEYIRIALRNRAPIVPFVTAGSAEIYPILGRIDWGWWRRYSEWPFLPITATFPFIPLPLPSKWHTRILKPIDLSADYPPEAADDPELVARIGVEIKAVMQDALLELKARRSSIFFGSVFQPSAEKTPRLYPTE